MDNEKLELLKKLRDSTGISFQKCKEALENNDYNLELAVKWLREKGNLKNQGLGGEKKFGIVQIGQNEGKMVAFTLNCQTDFVALSEKFQETAKKIEEFLLANFSQFSQTSNSQQIPSEINGLVNELSLATGEMISLDNCRFFFQKPQENSGIYVHHNKQIGALVLIEGGERKIANELALQVVANKPHFISQEKIPQQDLEKIKERFVKEAEQENPGKPGGILQKIVQGKLQKYLQVICFLEQNDFRQPELKIKDYLLKNQAKVNDFYLLKV